MPVTSCPNCQGVDIKRKISARTVAVLFGLLILDLFLLANTHYSPTKPSTIITVLALGAGVLMLMAPLALLIALFTKNHCRGCGHKWR